MGELAINMSLCSTNLQINLADAVISAAEASQNVRISTIFSLVAVSISEIIDPMENCCPGVWRETTTHPRYFVPFVAMDLRKTGSTKRAVVLNSSICFGSSNELLPKTLKALIGSITPHTESFFTSGNCVEKHPFFRARPSSKTVACGLSCKTNAAIPATNAADCDVPLWVTNLLCPTDADFRFTPGAKMSGPEHYPSMKRLPEKLATSPFGFTAPTERTLE